MESAELKVEDVLDRTKWNDHIQYHCGDPLWWGKHEKEKEEKKNEKEKEKEKTKKEKEKEKTKKEKEKKKISYSI